MKKYILGIIIVFSILVVINCAMPSFAATSGKYTYEVLDGKATITACDTTTSGTVKIPSTLGGYSVKSIGEGAFYDCDSLSGINASEDNSYYSSDDGNLF